MSLKPIKLFSHASGPNPWKVVLILEELGLAYETEYVDFKVIHTPAFEKYNPNGRVPWIVDPNHSDSEFTLWESGAVIEYLVDTYDKEHKISFPERTTEAWHAKQWLYFQVSGQGPYFGQAAWFTMFHAEKVPSAVERYVKEIKRVTGVLDSSLKGKEALVGNKISFADLAFLPWYGTAERIAPDAYKECCTEYPDFKRWSDGMHKRSAVEKTFNAKAEAGKAGH